MMPFAGFEMPVQYQGINAEHKAVREKAGLFDVSHMGEFILQGNQAEAFLQMVTINDITTIKPGQAQYSAMCNTEGGIIDDLLVYRYDDYFMLVVNAANISRDFEWLKSHLAPGVVLNDRSDKIALIAIQGPQSGNILSKILGKVAEDLEYYRFQEMDFNGRQITLARTGYTGELGFELYADSGDIVSIWDTLLEAGQKDGLVPAGLGCRDTLRMEMKYCLYGNELTTGTNPIEAGLGWITKLDSGDFIGKNAIVNQKENLTRRLVCVEMVDRGIPRKGYKLVLDGEIIGVVTSGTQSPSLHKGIALAYVDIPNHKSGTEVFIEIRNELKRGIIIKPPFYKDGTVLS